MVRHGIPTAKWKAFSDAEEACEHLRNAKHPALVVKASGLAAGKAKGVIVARDKEEAVKAVKEILQVCFKIIILIIDNIFVRFPYFSHLCIYV